jgi:hypothetical protein
MTKSDQEMLSSLQKWFQERCDGDWEHGNGIKIYTVDNPGWRLKIDIAETALERKPFLAVDIERTETDWVQCWTEGSVFNAAGGVGNLSEMIGRFLDWAQDDQPITNGGSTPS